MRKRWPGDGGKAARSEAKRWSKYPERCFCACDLWQVSAPILVSLAAHRLAFPPALLQGQRWALVTAGRARSTPGSTTSPPASHGRRGGAERRALRRTLSSGNALQPPKYKFGLPPGTESANLLLFIPFFFARAALAVLPRYCARAGAAWTMNTTQKLEPRTFAGCTRSCILSATLAFCIKMMRIVIKVIREAPQQLSAPRESSACSPLVLSRTACRYIEPGLLR